MKASNHLAHDHKCYEIWGHNPYMPCRHGVAYYPLPPSEEATLKVMEDETTKAGDWLIAALVTVLVAAGLVCAVSILLFPAVLLWEYIQRLP